MPEEKSEDMTHKSWAGQLDAYLDGQLDSIHMHELELHLRECPECAAGVVHRMQWKRAIHSAGQYFVPDPALRERIQKSISPAETAWWHLRPAFAVLAAVLLLLAGARIIQQEIAQPKARLVANSFDRDNLFQQSRIVGELADLHVATLASANPVDVVSSDRHNVKPWFAGKIPFTFDLPELQGTQFELVGGKVSYLEQSPGAQLLFRVRKHKISVFIFQTRSLPVEIANSKEMDARSFHLESWRRKGLQYFVIGDVASEDIEALSNLLKQ
jgi:anti-sigma factor RsiW